MITRNIFSNYLNQKTFEQKGYVVIEKFFSEQEVLELQSIYSCIKTTEQNESSFFTTHWINDKRYRAEIHDAVSHVMNGRILPLFNNYKNIFGYFLTKTGAKNNEVTVHRDWSIVDETYYTGINAWIPLCDTDKENGCFQVLEGSHLHYSNVRGSNIEIDYEVEQQQALTSLFLKAGDLLLFNQKLLHASAPNLSGNIRLAAGMVLIPEESTPLHFTYSRADATFYRLTMKDDFLVETCFNRLSPQMLSLQLLEACAEKVEIKNLPVIEEPKRRTIFMNEANDEFIYDAGMFSMPVLTRQQVKECLEVYNLTQSGMGDKFYNTIASNDLDYRKEVNNRLEKIIGNCIRPLFKNYKVLVYNFAAKTYGEGSNCNIHNDDSHADENLHTCINIWIPLVDVNDENGSLYVLPNSHKLPYSIRGIGLPFAYEKYTPLIEPFLQVMTMKAGDGLFFDSRLIHGSYENKLEKDRPAIILAMLPEEAEPLVYMKHNQMAKDCAELFEAPSDFYLNVKIGERPIDYKSRGVYRFTMADISEKDFLSIVHSKAAVSLI